MSANCTTITAGLATAGDTALNSTPVVPSATAPTGLTSAAAARLLISVGANAVADVAQHPARRALLKLWAPVPWMLEAAIVLQLAIGDYAEAWVVALLLVTNAALGFFQEGRAQATLDALKSRLALVAAVRRDGVLLGRG
jgi:H+-transporting ATPase